MGRWRNWLTYLEWHQSLTSVDWCHPVRQAKYINLRSSTWLQSSRHGENNLMHLYITMGGARSCYSIQVLSSEQHLQSKFNLLYCRIIWKNGLQYFVNKSKMSNHRQKISLGHNDFWHVRTFLFNMIERIWRTYFICCASITSWHAQIFKLHMKIFNLEKHTYTYAPFVALIHHLEEFCKWAVITMVATFVTVVIRLLVIECFMIVIIIIKRKIFGTYGQLKFFFQSHFC